MSAALLILLSLGASDPRIVPVDLRREGKEPSALAEVDRLLRDHPQRAANLGLWYLRGDILDGMGRRTEAVEAFARAMGDTPRLRAHARLRIAHDQETLGHPEVAAGLAATLLGSDPPRSLISEATAVLSRTLRAGGDCRLLGSLSTSRFPDRERRAVSLSRAECGLRNGDGQRGLEILLELLREQQNDLTSLLAARVLDGLLDGPPATEVAELLGIAFHQHRQFERSLAHLQSVVDLGTPVSTSRDFDRRFRFARGNFWLERFDVAASRYADLARQSPTPRHAAQAHYHRGRSLELAGRFPLAITAFREAYATQPDGSFAAASLLAAIRLEWLLDRPEDALTLFEVLRARPDSRVERARAALFLASSDIVRERADRAATWLDEAVAASRAVDLEASYWRGRLAEVRQDVDAAVRAYVDASALEYFHPHAQLALQRLQAPPLRSAAEAHGLRLAAAGREPFQAWILLGDDSPEGRAARRQFQSRMSRAESAQAPLLPTDVVPIDQWPLWRAPLTQPEELLLALGLFGEGASAVSRHFPLTQPSLAFTAALELGRAGRTREALLIAEVLHKRAGRRLPSPFAPPRFRQLLFPYPHRYLIERAAARHGIEPLLLAALIREESRFDPRAHSAAAARGLTQFVFSTAQRVAERENLGPLSPLDLERPEIAIELGAAYLHDLSQQFGGAHHAMIAAYNAGEPQVRLWRRYCHGDDPAEFLTKVAFQETRGYLVKVLSSYGEYRDLYPASPLDSRSTGW
ncbi:MAG TPA: transglycosylase SLT domain-containing protein [Thermoanaerobaculia bacterium]|nr:transglycosylase SLT domain-containing protein [Thermoanaerobaculia bacterium]